MQQVIVSQSAGIDRVSGMALPFKSVGELCAGFGKLVELNLQTLSTSIAEQRALLDAMLSADSLDDAVEFQSQILSATLKKQHAYWRHVGDIAVQTQSGLMGDFVEYAERVAMPWADVSGTVQEQSALLLPADVADTGRAPEMSRAEGPVAIVDSAGNVVSTPASGDMFH